MSIGDWLGAIGLAITIGVPTCTFIWRVTYLIQRVSKVLERVETQLETSAKLEQFLAKNQRRMLRYQKSIMQTIRGCRHNINDPPHHPGSMP